MLDFFVIKTSNSIANTRLRKVLYSLPRRKRSLFLFFNPFALLSCMLDPHVEKVIDETIANLDGELRALSLQAGC